MFRSKVNTSIHLIKKVNLQEMIVKANFEFQFDASTNEHINL